ncbi:MAG: NfeD family protein [Methylacidiphilales bacterium]|nr:NfeD family protein [Candidatus Methylacidiphilales bacterium]
MIGIVSLILAGILLLAAEIFLPGLIAGILGIVCLLGAAARAWSIYGANAGLSVLGAEFSLGIILFLLWMKYFPRSALGKVLSLDNTSAPRADENAGLLGSTGKTVSLLRPSGTARIQGRRVDVITEGQPIPPDTDIKVVKVDGARIMVRKL